jgi:hypothetical protein
MSSAPTWYNTIQAYFTAAAGRPNSISCMQNSQYQIDLSNPATFPGPDPTGGGYANCGLAILAAITPPSPGQPAFMPEAPDRQFDPTELATYTAWCNAGYPVGTPPSASDEASDAPRGPLSGDA